MILLICGGRDFNDYGRFCEAMKQLPFKPDIVVHGGADGADKLGEMWAIQNGIHYAKVPALWKTYKNAAGNIRNSAMLILKPDYCVAMPGGTGTDDMVKKCIDNNIPVWRPYA